MSLLWTLTIFLSSRQRLIMGLWIWYVSNVCLSFPPLHYAPFSTYSNKSPISIQYPPGKYGQLGLPVNANNQGSSIYDAETLDEDEDGLHTDSFQRHPYFGREHGREVVDCFAGFWNTFVM